MSIKFEDRLNIITLVEGAISCEEFADGTCKYLDKDENILPSPSNEVIQARKDEIQAQSDSVAYARARRKEYQELNQLEMQFDDQVNGTTTWVDAINAIKAKYPKP